MMPPHVALALVTVTIGIVGVPTVALESPRSSQRSLIRSEPVPGIRSHTELETQPEEDEAKVLSNARNGEDVNGERVRFVPGTNLTRARMPSHLQGDCRFSSPTKFKCSGDSANGSIKVGKSALELRDFPWASAKMKLFHGELNQETVATLKLAPRAGAVFDRDVTFHAYIHDWATLDDHKFASVKSVYFTNVHKRKDTRRIWLWTCKQWPDDHTIIKEISRYATLKLFDRSQQLTRDHPLVDAPENFPEANVPYFADAVRMAFLYNYGGLYFDVDVLCLRDFDPLFSQFKDDTFVYAWERQSYPNNAIIWSPQPKHPGLAKTIKVLVDRHHGMSFQASGLTYDLDVPLVVLPCSWFDIGWMENSMKFSFHEFLEAAPDKQYRRSTFFPGAFAFHWHNQWGSGPIPPTSALSQLLREIEASA